jgi:hypothetical protein
MATNTVGSGGTYTDLNSWVALRCQAVDPFSEKEIAAITAGGVTTSDTQDITGFDENGQGWEIKANTGASFREHASAATNPLFYDETKGAFVNKTSGSPSTIRVDVDNGTIRGLQCGKDSGYNYVIETTSSGNTLTLEDYIVGAPGGTKGVLLRKGDSRRYLIVTNGANGIDVSSGGGSLDRGTLVDLGGGGVGIHQDYGSWTLTNNAVAGYTTDADGTLSGSHNATDKAAGGLPSTNRQNSLVAATEWEGATSDFRVKSTSVKLKDNGTGSSVDIIGQSPSGTVDIGAWEFQAGGGGGGGAQPFRVPDVNMFGGMHVMTGGMNG